MHNDSQRIVNKSTWGAFVGHPKGVVKGLKKKRFKFEIIGGNMGNMVWL